MKVFLLTLGLTALVTNVAADPKKFTVPFAKRQISPSSSVFYKRAVFNSSIYNYYGSAYVISVDVGTPAQSFDVVLDTGR